MRGVDQDPLRLAALARQFGENLVEHAQAALANEPIVDRLVRAIIARAHRKSHRLAARHPGRSGEFVSPFLDADLRALRTGDGRPLPTHLVAELNRLRRRLSLTLEMIRELGAVREQALEAQHDSASRTVKALCTIRGIGVNFASLLTREVFYRTFDNRRKSPAIWVLPQRLFRAPAWIAIGASIAPTTAEPAKR